jgi:predicted thioesterase
MPACESEPVAFQPSTSAVTHTVTDDDTAIALGSGDVPVLATPRLVAWCEEATCAALDLDEATTSVGTRIELEHLAASAVGAVVTATATLISRDGRMVRFQVVAHDDNGTVLASGEVRRVVVDRERFLARLNDSSGRSSHG